MEREHRCNHTICSSSTVRKIRDYVFLFSSTAVISEIPLQVHLKQPLQRGQQLKHGGFNHKFAFTHSIRCSSRLSNMLSTPISSQLGPPGPFLLSAQLEKSQGIASIAKSVCYQHREFFMARVWESSGRELLMIL